MKKIFILLMTLSFFSVSQAQESDPVSDVLQTIERARGAYENARRDRERE